MSRSAIIGIGSGKEPFHGQGEGACGFGKGVEPYRAKSYAELRGLIGQIDAHEVANPDGPDFQVEFEAFWDHRPDGNICVLGSVDDGRWSAFSPLCNSFIVAPDGSFVGE